MWYDILFEQVESMGDEVQAQKMEAYMRNKFRFLGIPKPQLKKVMNPFLKEQRGKSFDWDFVMLCWNKGYREAQYIGLEYILKFENSINSSDLDKLKFLITQKSWWETTDNLDSVVGYLVQKDPSLKEEILNWSRADNIWLRRTAIDCQQKFKEKTDTELLSQIILNNLNTGEFFIDKAIGWSLREYKKINDSWVNEFLLLHDTELSMLSKKEVMTHKK